MQFHYPSISRRQAFWTKKSETSELKDIIHQMFLTDTSRYSTKHKGYTFLLSSSDTSLKLTQTGTQTNLNKFRNIEIIGNDSTKFKVKCQQLKWWCVYTQNSIESDPNSTDAKINDTNKHW